MITMTEIARLTHVSQPTVSRVLNGSTSVKPEVRERVLACAREHNYQPNALAQGMKSSRTRLLGVLMTDISNGFFADLAKQIEIAARRAGYSIILFNSDYDPRHEQDCLDVMRRYKVDGVLAVPIHENSEDWRGSVAKLDVPTVVVTRWAQGMDSVYLDHFAAGLLVARHMIGQGYERFLFIGRDYDTKYRGFCQGLREEGLAPEQVSAALPFRDFPSLKQDLIRLLPPGEPAGLFGSNDIYATHLLRALYELHLEVPAQAGVVGFDNTYMSQYLCPSLSTVTQPVETMARKAVERLLYKIDHPDDPEVLNERLAATLTLRESSRRK